MTEQEDKEFEDKIFKYENTTFYKECDEILKYISNTYKNLGFIDKYFEFSKGEITEENLVEYIRNELLHLDEYYRHDLNQMSKMLSTSNCAWYEYAIGKIVHEQLLKIWFPKEYAIKTI